MYNTARNRSATGALCSAAFFLLSSLACPAALAVPLKGGIRYYNAEDYKNAMPVFEQLLRRNPNNEQARYYLALCYQREQQTARANEHFEWLSTHARNGKIRAYALGIIKTVKPVTPTPQRAQIPVPNKDYAAGAVSTAETMLSASVPTAEKAVLPQFVQTVTPPDATPPGIDKGAGNHQELCKVIYFYKDGDGACAKFDSDFAAVQARLKGKLEFAKVKVDDPGQAEAVKKYGVKAVPALVYLDGNGALIASDGANTFDAQTTRFALKP